MFVEKNNQNQAPAEPEFPSPPSGQIEEKSFYEQYLNIETGIVFALLIILAISVFYYVFFRQKAQDDKPGNAVISTSTNGSGGNSGGLPADLSGNGNGSENGGSANIKAENLTFAYFYKKEEDDSKANPAKLELPLNAKADAANYYDLARKINLDPSLDQLNNKGFAILNNPFVGQADNFFSVYDLLIKKDIPALVTSDFLLYYYQNILKDVYKEVEKNFFYQDIWEISKSLFTTSNNKYKEKRVEMGLNNNTILEGRRLETAYFAVALELLKPKADQITKEANNDSKFSEKEAALFDFVLPVYLEDDVKNEIALIKQMKENAKSPIMLYSRDYREFAVPDEYKKNAKLNNYYLAAKWMNLAFPLYYKDEACPDCLLDKDDWLINMFASCSIAKDFAGNQELKNKWAKIYKIYSFFAGLRSDLTHLHYNAAMSELFGENYDLNEIFSPDSQNRDKDLTAAQSKIAEYEFAEIEGGINKKAAAQKPQAGLKLLQDSYRPDDYIFANLLSPAVSGYLGGTENIKKENITSCGKTEPYRCRAIGMDVINLISPIAGENEYFSENANYQGYAGQAEALKKQINNFTVDSWHNTNYWAFLDMGGKFLNSLNFGGLVIPADSEWNGRKLNTVLGGWANLRLAADNFEYKTDSGNKLGFSISDFNYIEPDSALINELIANSKMLSQMLLALGALNDKDFAYVKLNDFASEMGGIRSVVKKEMNNEAMSYDDQLAVYNLINKYSAVGAGKSFSLRFGGASVTESIDGVKLLVIIYNYPDGRKIFALGPIFNYRETAK